MNVVKFLTKQAKLFVVSSNSPCIRSRHPSNHPSKQ
jgi:hypothetical protein